MVLVCWRGLDVLVPVPGACADRFTAITPRVSEKDSSGSPGWKLMLNAVAVGPPPSRRSKVWSRNWPHCHANCDSRRSSNTSTLVSLMTRLLIWRALGPPNGWLMPSVYFAGPTRAYGVPALPHVG